MKNLLLIAFCCFSVLSIGQVEEMEITMSGLERPFDYKGTFCDYIEKATYKNEEITRSNLYNWANNGTVLKWLEYDGITPTQQNVDYHFFRLVYKSFAKCEVFRNNYSMIFDSDNIGNADIEMQHKEFSAALYFFQMRGRKVLPPVYKAFENIDRYKINLLELDQVAFMSTKYLGDKKYRVTYYHFNPSGASYPLDQSNKLMEIEVELGEEGFVNFTYSEDAVNIEKTKSSRDMRFGTPPPPPSESLMIPKRKK